MAVGLLAVVGIVVMVMWSAITDCLKWLKIIGNKEREHQRKKCAVFNSDPLRNYTPEMPNFFFKVEDLDQNWGHSLTIMYKAIDDMMASPRFANLDNTAKKLLDDHFVFMLEYGQKLGCLTLPIYSVYRGHGEELDIMFDKNEIFKVKIKGVVWWPNRRIRKFQGVPRGDRPDYEKARTYVRSRLLEYSTYMRNVKYVTYVEPKKDNKSALYTTIGILGYIILFLLARD